MDTTIYPYSFRIIRPSAELEPDGERATLPAGVGDSAYTFQIEASNLNLDFYYTHMTRKTLTNFANAAKAGVQFLDSHNNRNLGYGRTYGGQVKVDATRQPAFVVPDGVELAVAPPSQYAYALLDVFTIPGIRFGGGLTYASTDDFIRAVDTGLASDVSVGFYGGNMRCDVCGNDYLNYQVCSHFAGRVYGVGEGGARQVLATVAIDGASLAEVSAVYDGATPNASILKARAMVEAGQLDGESKRFIEMRYKVDLPTGQIFPVVKVNGRSQPANEERTMDYEAIVNDVRGILAETAAPDGVDVPAQVRWLIAENGRLQPLADEGRAYRSDLVNAALAEGVRAYGETFSQETYRGILEAASLDAVKRMTADWKMIGDKRFTGGRQIADEQPHPEQEQQPRRAVSRAAHKVQ